MTCIVTCRTKQGVCMGGDAWAGGDYSGFVIANKKVFKSSNGLLVGYTTSFRMGQILEYHVSCDKIVMQDPLHYLIMTYIPAVREAFQLHGYLWVENARESAGQFLVALSGRIFCIDSNFQVLEPDEPYTAIGSGEAYALGALYATYKEDTDPMSLCRVALEAAAAFASSVRAPFDYIEGA